MGSLSCGENTTLVFPTSSKSEAELLLLIQTNTQAPNIENREDTLNKSDQGFPERAAKSHPSSITAWCGCVAWDRRVTGRKSPSLAQPHLPRTKEITSDTQSALAIDE